MKALKITPAQALLLLIEVHKDQPGKEHELKRWYLEGIDESEHESFENALKHPSLKPYQILNEFNDINRDPTRRYFETHLAFHTVENGLDRLSKDDLQVHIQTLINRLPNHYPLKVHLALKGVYAESEKNVMIKEYAHYIKQVKDKQLFPRLSTEQREKLTTIIQCSLLGVIIGQLCPKSLPLNIYGKGLFSKAKRGLISIEAQQSSTTNQHLGVMKGHMPLSQDDIASSPTGAYPFLKSTERSTFDKNAVWVRGNASMRVHPFVNSISGTMLLQLRNLLVTHNTEKALFTKSKEQFESFNQVFISSLLFGSGGHSLMEFTAPLKVSKVYKQFKDCLGPRDNLMADLFFNGNTTAFEKALEETQRYNKRLLQQQAIHQELGSVHLKKAKVPASFPSLAFAQLRDLTRNFLNHINYYQQKRNKVGFFQPDEEIKEAPSIQKTLSNAAEELKNGQPEKAYEMLMNLTQTLHKMLNDKDSEAYVTKGKQLITHIEETIDLLTTPDDNPSPNK